MTDRFWFLGLAVICNVVQCSPLWPLTNKSNKLTHCQTQECIRSASSILKNMNSSANPCEDFYNFACGSFIKQNSIPGHKTSVDQFSKISDSIKKNIRTVLEKQINKDELIPFTLAKQFYKSCMDTASIEKHSLPKLREILANVGGWPVLDKDWDESQFIWYDTIHKMRKEGLGFGCLMDFRVNVDIQNTTKRIISITQPSLSLHRKHLLQGFQSSEVRNYFDYIVDVVISLGADLETAQKDISDSMYFEMEIARLSLSSEEKRVPITLVSPISFAQKRFPGIPWLHYLNGILLLPSNITDEEVISVASLAYMGNLTSLVRHYPKRVVANYMIRRAIGALIRYMPKKYRDFQFRFSSQTTGVKTMLPRWEDCFNIMMSIMPLTLGIIYVREYFSEERRREAQDIVDNIVKYFHVGLDELDWMDEVTRMRAKEKSRNITTLIGYPDELLDDAIVTEHYKGLTLTNDHLMGNMLNLWLFSETKMMETLHKPVVKGDWRGHGKAATVNAYYNYVKHAVEFSAGIFQGAFFHKDRPKYLNYGAIGPVIGHEVSHGFDDTGSRLNAGGNLENWWDSRTKQQFLQRAQCFIDQYGSFQVPEVNQTINGVNSQGEIIADNGGLKSSYKAYLKWESEHGVEPKLPGLNYTSRQLFWISYANTGCENLRLKALALKVLASNHPPYKYRVNGALANNEDFAQDFNCLKGTPMNPVNKCSIWR